MRWGFSPRSSVSRRRCSITSMTRSLVVEREPGAAELRVHAVAERLADPALLRGPRGAEAHVDGDRMPVVERDWLGGQLVHRRPRVPVGNGAVLVMLEQVWALELQHLLHAHLRNLLPDLAQARRRALHKAELVLDEVLGVLLEKLESLEKHTEDLIKYKFGFVEGSPAGLREVGQKIAKMCVQKMLELECPNLLEHDQHRAIAYGHTWSPVYELTPKPVPLHHGHAISIDMCFSVTWAAMEGWISESLRDRVHAQFRRAGLSLHHDCFTTEKLHYGTKTIMERRDGDLYAAIPDGEIGRCRYVYLKDFKSRSDMDASLDRALQVHKNLMVMEGG